MCGNAADSDSYGVFHVFGQAKFLDGGSVLGSSQFLILPQLPPKILLDSKSVKIDPKIVVSLRQTKSVIQSIGRSHFYVFME